MESNEFQDATDGFSDDGRTQVPNVHLLGDIGTGKVHQTRLLRAIVHRFRERLVLQGGIDFCLQVLGGNLAHDEPRSLNAHFLNDGMVLSNPIDDDLGQLLRARDSFGHATGLLETGKGRHGHAALVISVLGGVAFLDDVAGEFKVGGDAFHDLGKDRRQHLGETGIGVDVYRGKRAVVPDGGSGTFQGRGMALVILLDGAWPRRNITGVLRQGHQHTNIGNGIRFSDQMNTRCRCFEAGRQGIELGCLCFAAAQHGSLHLAPFVGFKVDGFSTHQSNGLDHGIPATSEDVIPLLSVDQNRFLAAVASD
mmetsp:Transcript_26315/g.57645  ORF Transcript_26315/g.57645 Transcript_26315/m.57645 type:complete len:309 (+) Transcript_26315:1493-2419(+)